MITAKNPLILAAKTITGLTKVREAQGSMTEIFRFVSS